MATLPGGNQKNFQISLLHASLINYYENVNPDPRIVTAIQRSVDLLWSTQYREYDLYNYRSGGFLYCTGYVSDCGTALASVAHNGLDAYSFYWVADKTGQAKYSSWGDELLRIPIEEPLQPGVLYYQNWKNFLLDGDLGYYRVFSSLSRRTTTPDIIPPTIFTTITPQWELVPGTTQTTLFVQTQEAANCRYAASPVAYASMTPFASSTQTVPGAYNHASTITGLSTGTLYTYFVRCRDLTGNEAAYTRTANFSVAPPGVCDEAPTTTWRSCYYRDQNFGTVDAVSNAANPSVPYNYDTQINGVSHGNGWSARWTKTITYTGGTVNFTVAAAPINTFAKNDAVRVLIDGVIVADDFTFTSTIRNRTFQVPVTAGPHVTRVEFADSVDWQELQFSMAMGSPSTPIARTGDLNNDGRVDAVDLAIAAADLGRTGCGRVTDLRADCVIDVFDLVALTRNWG